MSYLSMIENGKRVPSMPLMRIIAGIFQKDVEWFFDETLEDEVIVAEARSGGIDGMPLEPGFLFSGDLLQIAIPELLSQTGTTGTQFAHLLIRAHQETRQNRFPDLERAAEGIGRKLFPLRLDDVRRLCRDAGLTLRWFDHKAGRSRSGESPAYNSLLRSFFEAPGSGLAQSRTGSNAATPQVRTGQPPGPPHAARRRRGTRRAGRRREARDAPARDRVAAA
ncbi:MAG: helix-turn-helix transcriptional regulator [Woeseiaceae bacterium]|nr:helix-turn-helix transcriptional regulator [Woeseiaceae bacterium]